MQKLDSVDSVGNGNEEQRAALMAAMKNRSYSVTEEQPKGVEERRFSVSGADGGKFYSSVQGKPDGQLLPNSDVVEKEVNGEGVVKLQVDSGQPVVDNQTKCDKVVNDENVKASEVAKETENAKDEVKLVEPQFKAPTVQPQVENNIQPEVVEKKVQSPKTKVDEINRNVSEEKKKEVVNGVKAEEKVVEEIKKDTPKGRNTPDLKIPLKKKSAPKKG